MSEQEMEYSPDIYTLEDEEGKEHTFELVDEMEVDGVQYFAFIPYYEDPAESLQGDAQLVILKAETIDGEDMMASIDDDDEYDRIGSMFLARLSDFDEEEEEEE